MSTGNTGRIDASCLACSLPLVKLAAKVRQGSAGEVFEAVSDSPGFLDDVKLWCLRTGHNLVSHLQDEQGTSVVIRKN